MNHLRKLKTLVTILPIDEQIVDCSLDSDFSDFEDALQYYTAKQHNIRYLITRNTRDYKNVDKKIITVMTAEEYLSYWLSSELS